MTPRAERDRVYRNLAPESARRARDIALRGVAVAAAAVRYPRLVVGAEHDRITPPSLVRRVARRYGATLFEYPGFGHMVPLEPRWRQVAVDVATWLAMLAEADGHGMSRVAQSSRACHEPAMLGP